MKSATKFGCRVVGHEMIFKKDQTLVKIKLKNEVAGLKVELIVDEEERVNYPFGSYAIVDFSVQQPIPFEK
jgi:hypothetical protein